MNNLFSIFDPQTHSFLYLNWASTLLILALLPSTFWLCANHMTNAYNSLIAAVNEEMKAVMGSTSILGTTLVPISLFVFIVLNNSLGLASYTFTATSHLSLAFSIALPLWVGHVVYAWINSTNAMLAHLVPLGTPNALMPFMVLIEMVSNIIRPLTLSVRLAANMVAGHLLLTLLSSSCLSVNYPILVLIMASLILLSILETAVAAIQAYVFSILSTLYVSDINPSSFLN